MTHTLGPKISSSEITPREIYLSRRHFMGGALATGAALAASSALSATSPAALSFSQNAFPKPSDAVTDRALATTYNNFYEFGTSKSDPARMPENLQQNPGLLRLAAKSQSRKQLALKNF